MTGSLKMADNFYIAVGPIMMLL